MATSTPTVETGAADDPHQSIDFLPTMAWVAAPSGGIEFVNRQCVLFTGVPREQLLGSGLGDCFHPDDRPLRELARARLAEGQPFECEFRMRRHDGTYARCVTRAVPVRNDAGDIVQWVGTTTDVEDLRRATDELRLQEEHLQLALDSADVGIWRLKLPDYDLTADDRTRRHLDLDANEVHGYRPQDHIHPQDFERALSLQMPLSDGRYVTEHRVRQRDGSYRWQAIHWRVYPDAADPNAGLITGTSMDITARRETEAEREELGQRYRMALSAAELGTWSYDVAQNLIHLDDRARAHFDVNASTLTIEHCLARLYEQDRDRTRQRFQRQLQESTRKDRATAAFRVRHASGDVHWISSHVHVTFDADGRPVRVIGVTQDITETRRAEEQVKRVNADLERRVQQRTAELSAANQELESFAYTVSHDLRAPLRAILGFCDALIEDHGNSLPAQAHEYLQHVIDGSRHLGEIIEGLLTLSRSTRGTLRHDDVDLSALAEKVLRDMTLVEPARRVTWSIEPELRVHGDSRMLDVVMRNLLGNAWKYTANRADAALRVYAQRTEAELTVCIEDNGAGFRMEHAEKLFQPFQRLHRQDEFVGLGIGLATVQRIVHRHGGKVSGTGLPGQGAIFRFSLPLSNEQTSAAEEEKKS
ncbi:MAG TPA: PAS domain-containing protein [Povalibacter sp.]|uniref:PAS domain-containing protein n=1 Tax=Povalibacter sp. TaxID=1962978 RepID=UPI002B9BCE02|nr:PAS domain-containing protein [Povalibacter sp.]HMN46577.1 PAS domain-containing protein [Povalibacter sp.]